MENTLIRYKKDTHYLLTFKAFQMHHCFEAIVVFSRKNHRRKISLYRTPVNIPHALNNKYNKSRGTGSLRNTIVIAVVLS